MPGLVKNIIENSERRVLALALSSRLLVLFLMSIADVIFSDLDSSSHLQNFPCGNLDKYTLMPHIDTNNSWIARFLDGLAPWDSVYFVRVAKCGYETDMIHAFFPFLPFLMRYGAKYTGLEYIALRIDVPIEPVYTALGLGINLIAFCIAALALYRLSRTVLQNEELASLTALLFCLNPASVFYSAAYTEALFAACTWTGLVFLSKSRGGGNGVGGSKGRGENFSYWVAGVVMFALGGATRSNGILSAWFLIHDLLIDVYTSITNRKKAKKSSFLSLFPLAVLLKTMVGCAIIWAPYFIMQVYGYRTFCTPATGSSNGNPLPVWCSKKPFPSLYGYVQKAYWDVGFLRFYRYLNRWPWLLQSAPVFYITIVSCWMWMSADWKRAFSLAIFSSLSRKKKKSVKRKSAAAVETTLEAIRADEATISLQSDAVAPYIYHLAGMTAIALFIMHVNVATRFLSSSPALYWGAATLLLKAQKVANNKPYNNRSLFYYMYSNWIWLWAMVFAVLGSLLFSNSFPWT